MSEEKMDIAKYLFPSKDELLFPDRRKVNVMTGLPEDSTCCITPCYLSYLSPAIRPTCTCLCHRALEF